MRLTILFDAPYWVGLVEDERNGLLYAGRHIFGSEPSDAEVLAFVQNDLLPLLASLTVGLPLDDKPQHHANPKRVQREIRRELAQAGLPSKAHEAMRLQTEAGKQSRRASARAERDAERERRREHARALAQQRHRGH